METLTILLILGLIIMVILSFFAGKALGKRYMFEVMQSVMDKEKKQAVERSRAVLKGQFSEHMSPFGTDFPAQASECRFLGAPIDFIAFVGLDEKNVEEIVFIEVKSGKSQLNQTEKSIREAVKNKRVRFEEYRV
jgi:predicted Holliday junction resolvase-like endonuclease